MLKLIATLMAVALLFSMAGCSKMEKATNNASTDTVADKTTEGIKIPEIKSDDTVMPKYVDISLYDEENYADIYLGKDFKFNITYCGTKLVLPSSLRVMKRDGWSFVPDSEYNEDSLVRAGASVEVKFMNAYNNQINAVFYNPKASSVALKKCALVKFKVLENIHDNEDSVYGQFWVNGINNDSAITDIIDFLGSPSHFYAVSPNEYYLDYFIYEKDKRSGITVYVDPTDDGVHSIEFSCYK